MPQFVYSSIVQGEIRLLRLPPSFTDAVPTTQPSVELTTIKLSSTPSFEALSYQWTPIFCSRISKFEILVHGQPLTVNENLYTALQHLRLKDSERVIWIDAICINQSNDGEKEWHVDCMDEIYKSAASVVSWLGASEVWEENLLKDVAVFLIESKTGTTYPNLEQARVLAKICDNGYWGRTWVIQEVVLAGTISILFGTTILDFEALTDQKIWKKYREKYVTRGSIDEMLASKAFRLRALRDELQNATDAHQLEMPLLVAWIEYGARSECSFRTDEVFAVRSFAKKCCRDATPVQYKKNGRELFLSLTDHHFAKHRFEGEEQFAIVVLQLEFHAQLLRRYPVADATTLLPVGLGDWMGLATQYGLDKKFIKSVIAAELEITMKIGMKAVSSPTSLKRFVGTGLRIGTAPVRYLVDREWKIKQFDYWMLIREHVLGLVNLKPPST